MKPVFLLIFLFASIMMSAQYAPEAGMAGTTAIHQDSNVFVGWATYAEIRQGWINMSDTSLGRASFGSTQSALQKADNDVVSLGDGGVAILSFEHPVYNGPGWDFAVFENSFDGHFLELAFVEVSSDGQNYYRFPAHSLTQDSIQISAFGNINPTQIHNLAGKYKVGFGTPFDLNDLDSVSGLDINHIQKIKIIDAVGSLDSNYASFDTAGNIINDPWPMSFASSGFDLDAVGIIHQILSSNHINQKSSFKIIPNPATDKIFIKNNHHEIISSVKITSLDGKCVFFSHQPKLKSVNVSSWSKGIYILTIENAKGKLFRKKIVVIK